MLQIRKVADRSEGERNTVLVFKPEEGEVLDDGTVLVDPSRVEQRLVNPATEGYDHEPWPLSHAELIGDAPEKHNFSDTVLAQYLQDDIAELKNPRLANTSVNGTAYSRNPVLTGDEIVLKLKGKKLRYKVLEHPGRYQDDSEASGQRETHEYSCELVGGK